MWKHVHECLKIEESFEFQEKEERARLVAEERERRNQVQVLILWKHVHECFRLEESCEFQEREERARLAAEERERRNQVYVLILWNHVHKSFILEELFQSFCCFCGNMLMNV